MEYALGCIGLLLGYLAAQGILWSGMGSQMLFQTKRSHLLFSLSLAISMALVFAWCWSRFDAGIALWFWLGMSFLLLGAAFYDIAYQMIPEFLLWILVAFSLLASLIFSFPLPWDQAFLGGGAVGGLVLCLYLFTRGKGIGEADIYVASVLGLLSGAMKGLLVFSLANVLGLLVVLPMIVVVSKKRVQQVPLVFFMVLAVYVDAWFAVSDEVLALLAF